LDGELTARTFGRALKVFLDPKKLVCAHHLTYGFDVGRYLTLSHPKTGSLMSRAGFEALEPVIWWCSGSGTHDIGKRTQYSMASDIYLQL
jgi:hypothetical protein